MIWNLGLKCGCFAFVLVVCFFDFCLFVWMVASRIILEFDVSGLRVFGG